MNILKSSIFSEPTKNVKFDKLQHLNLFIGNEEHTVKTDDLPLNMTLNSYLRERANLRGTKNMCLEGGCGACIVAAAIKDPLTKREVVLAVNSCLVPIYLCSGWKIFTSESIGNSTNGYHPVQKALVQFNGTQCGFCSSGMVMNMYALYETGKFSMKEVENAFGGNMCRCTGYRPILTGFKSLSTDASCEIMGSYCDIEDIPIRLEKCKLNCEFPCAQKLQSHFYEMRGHQWWYKVSSINEILDVIRAHPQHTYMLVGGNTATGVYRRIKEPEIYIDITSVVSLIEYTMSSENLILGANMTLTNTINLFYKLSNEQTSFAYLQKLANHIQLIANVPVRNMGTLAGNLFTKHQHQEFPSDIYLILESVGATVTIVGTDKKEVTKTLVDFLSFNMQSKIIKSITLPALENYKYESYKVTPRAENAHALLHAAFLLKLDPDNKVEKVHLVYGAIDPSFAHATNAENYLIGKSLFDNETLQGLFQTLDVEIQPDHVLPDPSPEFRKQLAIALCYKFILSIAPDDKVSPRNKSGGSKLTRSISSGTQDYETNESLYPLTQPIAKIEALAQCSGTAQYIMDIPDQPEQLFAAFVVAKAPANSVISKIDVSQALKLPGVVAFYDQKDIPGENNFVPTETFPHFFKAAEEIFCSGIVKYYFQPVGVIVASTQSTAEQAADIVEIDYIKGENKPLLTVRDILRTNSNSRVFKEGEVKAKSKGDDVKHVVKGNFDIFGQYHYHMETQCCNVIPVEDGLDMYPSSQAVNISQIAAAKVLKIPANKINVSVRRVGGAYGGKITRNSLVSCAAALAAYKLQKPVKLGLPFIANMNIIGKRFPFSADYEVGVDEKGSIQYLETSLYTDLGCQGGNENLSNAIMQLFGLNYNRERWDITVYSTRTDTPTGTWCRAPGTTEAFAFSESVMEHIATTLNLDPISVRLQNLAADPDMSKYINNLKEWAETDTRKEEIEQFNKANRWIKRGIAVTPMLYPAHIFGYWNAHVVIYQGDGSVAVAHGGIEMGQGINTKVAQICAHVLGIPLDMVCVKPNNNLVSPNGLLSGGSITSESVCYATVKACETLLERMKATKEKMDNPTWCQLVQQSYLEGVDLCASSLFLPGLPDVHRYPIYGVTCAEVEIDILTGLYQIKRVDILEDVGDSMSPQIDVGQVEGAFVMGMGYWTSEQLIFSEDGELLTNRTWTYKPPGAKDIPVDFRVKFPKNNPNALSLLKAKATGEPSLCMACAIPLAIRNAIASARAEANASGEKWYPIGGPSTVENTFINSLHDYKQYTL